MLKTGEGTRTWTEAEIGHCLKTAKFQVIMVITLTACPSIPNLLVIRITSGFLRQRNILRFMTLTGVIQHPVRLSTENDLYPDSHSHDQQLRISR